MDEKRLDELERIAKKHNVGTWLEMIAALREARKERDEARSVVVEADAQFNIDKIPGSYDFAKVSIVRMAANGRAALDECEELRHKLEEANKDAEKLTDTLEDAHNGHNWKCKAPYFEDIECTCDYEKSLSEHYVRIDKMEGKL